MFVIFLPGTIGRFSGTLSATRGPSRNSLRLEMAPKEWSSLAKLPADEALVRSPEQKKHKGEGEKQGKGKGKTSNDEPMGDGYGEQAGEASGAQKRGDLKDLPLTDLLARVVLADRRGLRELRAGLQRVWILPQEHELYRDGKLAYKKYRAAVEKDGPEHSFGPPQPHLAESCFFLLARTLDNGGRKEDKEKLEALTLPLFQDGAAALGRRFTVWRWDTAFTPKGETNTGEAHGPVGDLGGARADDHYLV